MAETPDIKADVTCFLLFTAKGSMSLGMEIHLITPLSSVLVGTAAKSNPGDMPWEDVKAPMPITGGAGPEWGRKSAPRPAVLHIQARSVNESVFHGNEKLP